MMFKQLMILCLSLCLAMGCLPSSLLRQKGTTPPRKNAVAVPTAVSVATPTPVPTAVPEATSTPVPTPAPQTYAGDLFRFDLPYDWAKATTSNGIFFYPDVNDTRRTFLAYNETDNSMKLTERAVDLALLFSSQETITAMVEKAVAESGMTNFKLSPVTVKKAQLNGLTCYEGAASITLEGATYDFSGHVFLRGNKLALLVWVGDQSRYADGLDLVYRSIQALR